MKKIILILMLFTLSLFAEVKNEYISKGFLNQNIPIVDIRTPGEWRETGLLKDAIPIMFWDAKGKYDAQKFLNELNKKVDTTKPFALICHTGSRTSMVAPWLAKEFGYKVINLKGGMEYATKGLHVKTVPYKKMNRLKTVLGFIFFLTLRIVITLGVLGFIIFILWGILYLIFY